MKLSAQLISLKKRRPLTISRGTSTESASLAVFAEHEGVIGLGEMAPVGYGKPQTAKSAEAEVASLSAEVEGVSPGNVMEVEGVALNAGIGSATLSALNCACWDWVGKSFGAPLHAVFGLDKRSGPTSATVGINPPERVRELVPEALAECSTRVLKLKLGSPDGIEADKSSYESAMSAMPDGGEIRVDANAGWTLEDAIEMAEFLAARGCTYLEQPLGIDAHDDLAILYAKSPLPIFLDESVHASCDVPKVADRCHGVNVKLMKSGGLSEAMRIVHCARAHGLKTMIGCFSECSIGIASGASIAALFDYIDLDSHMNLEPDPASGVVIEDGCLVCSESPGHGASLL